MNPLIKNVELVTFDVYMALLDIQGGLTSAFADATGLGQADAAAMVALWRAKQMERAAISNSIGRARTSFRTCTEMALNYVCNRHQLKLKSEQRQTLVRAWDSLQPWPDAEAVLSEISAKGYPIAILSNGDQGMLESVAAQFRTPFDHVLSSASAGYYKPHPSVYALPQALLGTPKDATLHVAGSANDVLGSVAAGMRCVWSNRASDAVLDPAFPPDYEIGSLSELPSLL